jgi:hypothetical protein
MPVLPVVEKLPADYLLAIGEVVTTWARLEVELRSLTFSILGLTAQQGRTAVRTPRAKEMLLMIQELTQIQGLSITRVDMPRFVTFLELVENRRNLIAHSLWLQGANNTYVVQNLQGSWNKQEARKDGRHPKKRVDPEGVALKSSELLDLAENIREAIEATRIVGREIGEQLAALRRKQREQDQPASPPPQTAAPRKPRPTQHQK